MKSAAEVLRFWFELHGPDDWYAGKPEFDARIAAEFGDTHWAIARGEGWTWRANAKGRLAEIIVLDQFSRQLYRGRREAFSQDPMALALSQELVASGQDITLDDNERMFAYMPYMHSESLLVHDEALRLFAAMGDDSALEYERKHRDCIARFGRYPKRNAALGRQSTPEELSYIAEIGDRAF